MFSKETEGLEVFVISKSAIHKKKMFFHYKEIENSIYKEFQLFLFFKMKFLTKRTCLTKTFNFTIFFSRFFLFVVIENIICISKNLNFSKLRLLIGLLIRIKFKMQIQIMTYVRFIELEIERV
jgi:hypothetical protein